MEIVPLCPFEAGAFLWEAQPGQSSLTVLVKATFALAPGELRIADDQDPLGEERHFEDSALASLYAPGDYAPVKRKVDVMLVGHAYAPGGRPTEALVARLSVGDFSKSVRVLGDRAWTRDAAGNVIPSAPQPFTRMPIRYERAPLTAENPVGIDESGLASRALPNLAADDDKAPGFGPISPQWRSRRRTLDESSTFWAYGVARAPRQGAPPLGPMPPRFDFAFFNAAPPDQQIDLLRAGAPIVLENLDPEHPKLEARLPSIRPQVFRVPPPEVSKGRVEEIIVRCDSLWIDTDRRVLTLTWRGVTDVVGGGVRVGTIVVDADPEGKKLRWDRVEKRYAEARPPTLRLGDGAPAKAAVRRPIPTGPDPLAVRYDGRNRPPDGPSALRTPTLTEAVGPGSFSPDSIRDDPTNPIPPRDEPLHPKATIVPAPGASKSRVPVPASPKPPVASKLGVAPKPPVAKPPVAMVEPPRPPAAPPAGAVRASPTIEPATTPRPVTVRPPPSSNAPRVPKPVAARARESAAPPIAKTLLTPVATPAPAPPQKPLISPRPPVDEPASGLGDKAVTKSARPAPSGPARRLDQDVERYATICAELSRKGADRGSVLKAHLLTEPGWALVDQQWKRALADETEQGGRALLLAFDEAYLAAQQRLGKPIGVEEYARIQVAIERGEVGRVLGDLSLELGDLMRLQRVWNKRLGESPKLAADLSRAVEEMRWAT